MLSELTIKEFLEKTASESSTPGGGSVAALSAALAASLTEMVANLTIG
jgi:formiminotetrahydrofolate cyclodeaminase